MARSHRQTLILPLIFGFVFLCALAATTWTVLRHFLKTDLPGDNQLAAISAAKTPTLPTGIGGFVRNEYGVPIFNARLSLDFLPRPLGPGGELGRNAQVQTDAEGRWSTPEVPPGALSRELRIWVYHPDYVSGSVPVPSQDDLLSHKAVIVLYKGVAVSGTVVDKHGQPVIGARVTPSDARGFETAPTVKTDAQGHFALPHIPTGEIVLLTTDNGFAPDLQRFIATSNNKPLHISLAPGKTLRGYVVNAAAKPLPGVRVDVTSWRNVSALQWHGTTDAHGEFTMPNAPSDALEMYFTNAGYPSLSLYLSAGDGEARVVMTHGLHVHGNVIDAETGKPIASYSAIHGKILEQGQHINWGGYPDIYTSPGHFDFQEDETVFYAGYAIRVEARGYFPAVSRIYHDDEENVFLDFKLKRGGDLPATIFDPDGKPASGAVAMVAIPGILTSIDGDNLNNSGNQETWRAKADLLGCVKLPPQIPPFSIAAVDDKGIAVVRGEALAKSNQIHLRAWASIDGQLMIGNKPKANQLIYIHVQKTDSGSADGPQVDITQTLMTSASGAFSTKFVSPGENIIARMVPWYDNQGAMRTFLPDHAAYLNLSPSQNVQLTLGGTGRPVIGKIIIPPQLIGRTDCMFSPRCGITPKSNVKPPADRPSTSYPLIIADDNSFRVEDVPEGTYQLLISAGTGDWCQNILASADVVFKIPPMPGGRSDQPLDLGSIKMKLR